MTQAQAIERGYTHFIEVWRYNDDKEGKNMGEQNALDINSFDLHLNETKNPLNEIYTVAIFLIKPKPTH